jgi:hypothetical protein
MQVSKMCGVWKVSVNDMHCYVEHGAEAIELAIILDDSAYCGANGHIWNEFTTGETVAVVSPTDTTCTLPAGMNGACYVG